MCEFLQGDDLSERIREVVKGKDARCAVAFWGRDAVRELFGTEVLERDDVFILCDISMGGTNPETLRTIVKKCPENHGHVPGLHAKVYLSDDGMVVGSANASDNGIGFSGKHASHLETGTYASSETAGWQVAKDWFDRLWQASNDLNEDAIAAATKAWNKNKAARSELERATLLNTLLVLDALPGALSIIFCHGSYGSNQTDEYCAAAKSIGLDPDTMDLEPFPCGVFKHDQWPEVFLCLNLTGSGLDPTFYSRGRTAEGWHFAAAISWNEFTGRLGYADNSLRVLQRTELTRKKADNFRELAGEDRFFTVDDIRLILE